MLQLSRLWACCCNCPNLVRVIDKSPVTKSDSDSEESICRAEEPKNLNSDEEIIGDNLAESCASSPFKAVPVITEFNDVSPKESTSISSEVTLVITELTDVFLKYNTPNLPEITL